MENRFKLSPPWCTYINELTELFGQDPDINVSYNNEESTVYLRVDNADKYEILINVLPYYKKFGNVVLNIEVIPSNTQPSELNFDKLGHDDIFNILFNKNPAFSYVKTVDILYSIPFTYVVFTNKVIQFFNDNLNDVYGNMSTLYQYIAEDVFADAEKLEGVCYCTDIPQNGAVNVPLGEWP